MAKLAQSTFSRWELTSQEELEGQTLTTSNLMVLQNLICDAAEEKLTLKFDPANPLVFTQREAELQGQIGILKMLVEVSALATRALHSLNSDSQES